MRDTNPITSTVPSQAKLAKGFQGASDTVVPTTGVMGAAAKARKICRQFGWPTLVLFWAAPVANNELDLELRAFLAAPWILLALWVRLWARGYHRSEGFVLNGPYRYVRNPVESGAALAYVGFGLLLGAAYWYIPLVVALGMVYMSFLALATDKALVLQIGPSYLRYTQRVRRWWPSFLPGVNRATRSYSVMQGVRFEVESLVWVVGFGIVFGLRRHFLNN